MENNGQEPKPERGGGYEFLSRRDNFRSDLKAMERAIKLEWEVPESIRPKLVEIASGIYQDEKVDSRTRMAAAKVILAANGQNLKREAMERGISGTPAGGVTVNVLNASVDLSTLSVDELRTLQQLRAKLRSAANP